MSITLPPLSTADEPSGPRTRVGFDSPIEAFRLPSVAEVVLECFADELAAGHATATADVGEHFFGVPADRDV